MADDDMSAFDDFAGGDDAFDPSGFGDDNAVDNQGKIANADAFGFEEEGVDAAPVAEDAAAAPEEDVFGLGQEDDADIGLEATTGEQLDSKTEDPFGLDVDQGPLDDWTQERKEVLTERAEKAAAKKARNIEAAAQELAKFAQEQAEKLEAAKKQNLADQQEAKEDLAKLMEYGSTWEKVRA
jgi:hypothetical protein